MASRDHNQGGERACVAQEPCLDPGTRPEIRIPNAAAYTPLKSAAIIRRKLAPPRIEACPPGRDSGVRSGERDKSRNACSLCNATGLTRSEMSPLCSNFGIHVEERRLHKELISPARQRDDPIDVLFVVGSVDHKQTFVHALSAARVARARRGEWTGRGE